ncbi:conserved membrane hypothetical protein [groundwater metagenome]|uniref:Uncharacterized protein n=1 Tax=groundwater metagenome TaxID=717931 RepID=A0A098E9S7_9ZZZZ
MADKPMGILVCAILFAIEGALVILGGIAMLLMGGAMFGVWGADVEVLEMFAGMRDIFAVIILIIGVAKLAIAYGIWKMKKWARIAGIILAVIGLINIPIGTIISIVILYFLLMDKNTKDLFTE